MNDLDRLSLLKFATSTPFSTSASFFETLAAQFPQIGKAEIESYLRSKIEFEKDDEFYVSAPKRVSTFNNSFIRMLQ